MRPSSIAPVLLAALVCVFGCGGGGSSVAPDPAPAGTQALAEGDVLMNGTFVAGADVVAFDLTTGVELDRGVTDLEGHYLLDLPAGQIGIFASSTSGSATPAWINVSSGLEDVQQDFNLTAGTGGLLVGRVVDTKYAEPVPGATVTFGAQTVPTDGFGYFAIHSVGANATGTVSASAPGFNQGELEIRSGQAARAELITTAFFTVKPNTDTGSSLGGVVRDITDGDPLGGAIMTLSRPIDPSFTPVKRQTNLGGVWRFYNIPPGAYALEIRRDGFLTTTSAAVINTRDGVLNFFLEPDPAGRASISGTVFDFNGATPLNNCTIVASSGAYGKVNAVSNASGTYTLTDLVVDTPYTVFFSPSSTRNESISVTVTVPSSGLSLSPSLPENGTGGINGRVIKTGQTVPPVGARVSAEKVGEPESGRVFEAYVDSNGNYGLNGLPPGRYLVRASFTGPGGVETLALAGSTDVIKGQVTKRNITFP